jgi:uncharacterized repeat protein (TIGR03843 family)
MQEVQAAFKGTPHLLREGQIKPQGLMPDCSNYTYLAQVQGKSGAGTLAVYKPARGETPLDDFPSGTLGKREVAAHLVSEALTWEIVPLTVYRSSGPLGPGSLQQFINADLGEHLGRGQWAHLPSFAQTAHGDLGVCRRRGAGADSGRRLTAVPAGAGG